MIKRLSIIIPVYNESKTIFEVLETVTKINLADNIEKEVIVVNDRSSDDSQKEINRYIRDFPKNNISLLNHKINTGKGGAVVSGLEIATGDYIVIQDADLELVPEEINLLLKPVLEGKAKIVFGSRFINQIRKPNESILNHSFNKFITWLGRMVFGIKLTDTQTCFTYNPRTNSEGKKIGWQDGIRALYCVIRYGL